MIVSRRSRDDYVVDIGRDTSMTKLANSVSYTINNRSSTDYWKKR